MSIDVGKIHDIFPYSRSMKSRNYKMFLKRILKSDGILREAVYYEWLCLS